MTTMADFEFNDDQQLREELLKYDVTVSKITDKNREILIKKLNHLRVRQRGAEAPPSPRRSPGRQSPGRAKKSPRRSHVPVAAHFSSSDEDDSAPRATENVAQRHQKNLRRRTVDSGLMNGETNDVAVTPGRTRGMTANVEPVSEPGKNKRRSLGAAANSPFLAGSLRNPLVSQSGNRSGPRLRSSHVHDSMFDGEFSGSDDGYSFTEVASTGVNTTQSLHDMVDNTSPSKFGDLRSQQGKNKQWTSASRLLNIIYI